MDRQRDLFWKLTEPEHLGARAFCRKLMGNRDDGDDLYQDALVAALTKFADLRDATAYRPWLYRIIINTFRNRVRTTWWKRLLPLTPEMEQNAPGVNPIGEHAARRTLERAFKAIGPEERALVTLFELEGWSVRELAGLNGASEGAIKVRLSRARRKMREALARFPSASARRTEKAKLSEVDVCVVAKPGTD